MKLEYKLKLLIMFILIIPILFLAFSTLKANSVYAGGSDCKETNLVCDGSRTWCGSGTISCPCPDGTCYMNCSLICRPCIRTTCCISAYHQGVPEYGDCSDSPTTLCSGSGRYPNGSSISCCTPTCSGSCLIPSCPSGSTDIVNGCSVSSVQSCSYSNSCNTGSCSGGSRTCYYAETNTTFIQSNGSTSGPSSISIIVDGKTYSLSTNPAEPTHIKLPASGSSNVQVSVPTFTAPVTSRGGGYQFIANNYGNNNEGQTWTTCSGIAGEDFCTTVPSTSNTQNFVPTSKTVNQVLKEGATGKISGIYTTTDKCNNTYKYSLPTEGYYVVDYVPDPPDPCTPGSPACPWIPEITSSANTTQRGCSSLTYSGTEANNELNIKAEVTDTDGPNEVQSFALWFSKDTNVPTIGTISASYTGSITSDVGIMIKKNGSDWNNPNIYATNSNLTWGQISLTDGVGYINISGTNIIEISSISVTQGANVTFDYKIRFLNNDSNLSGMYNIYGGSLDNHMINGNTLDQSYFYKFFDWGVDLVEPTVEEIVQQIVDPVNTNITWSNADATSGIGRTVINAYRIGGLIFDQATLYNNSNISMGAKTLSSEIPNDNQIGLYNDPNTWQFTNNTGETDRLNIQTNERGEIALYITAYDIACNTNGNNANVDLDPWFATRGATVYSHGNISTTAKLVSGLPYLNDVFNPRTEMNSTLIDLGTEMLSTRNLNISNLIHPSNGATKATEKNDSNNVKDIWFNRLTKKLNQYKQGLTEFTMTVFDNSVSDSCDGSKCYMYSLNDISIPSGYTCDRPTLFISEKDIHINPTVQSDTNVLSGCIFLAKNNIYVDAGTFKSSSGTKVQYDYIEGFLIADNQIIFPIADEAQTLRDAVEIFGGMVAFGTNPTVGNSAIAIQRNLRLYSQINPTVVLTYDNKYSSISTFFFGTEYNLYKQEVGFKTF